mgnify:FL=1
MALWRNKNLNIFMDICTYCNAGCPQCHRTNPHGLAKQDWLPLIQWSLADFKKAFPIGTMFANTFHFCGTWGDPMMAKDIFKIVEYIILNSDSLIVITTNGSLRDEDFWWDFGALGRKRLRVTFDIDGITQEMHEKYRRFTKLDTVLTNMKMLSQTPARAESQTILFKHNENYRNEIAELATKNGSAKHEFVISDRFGLWHRNSADQNVGGTKNIEHTNHTDKNGNKFILEKANEELLVNPFIAGSTTDKLSDKIVCRWAMPRNEIIVNFDGQVLPCCYHQNAVARALDLTRQESAADVNITPEYIEYNNNKEQYNVFHTPLSDIIDSKWFTETLPNSMNSDKPVGQCVNNCSSRTEKPHQLRDISLFNGENV